MARRRTYGRLDGSAGQRRREFVLSYQGHVCAITGCYNIATEVDHKIPLFKGGPDTLENLRGLCKRCHEQKTKSERKEWTSRPRKRKSRISADWQALINSLVELHKN